MNKLLVFAAVAVVCLPAWASSPGERIDCTDWVALEPGYWCEVYTPDCGADPTNCVGSFGNDQALTVDGDRLYFKELRLDEDPDCNNRQYHRLEIRVIVNQQDKVIGYFQGRCSDPATGNTDDITVVGWVLFDAVRGKVIVVTYSHCGESTVGCSDPYNTRRWAFAIGGFTTLFEVFQSYGPPGSELGFRVPAIPEGFQYADYFDTYWGTLATVGDWSQAQPLQCGYPATVPELGDYLTVADTLPTPGPGQGYYYVTAVTYQGETRYGRHFVNRILDGRHAALLPACSD